MTAPTPSEPTQPTQPTQPTEPTEPIEPIEPTGPAASLAAAVDWDALRARAREVMSRAYAPYSRYPVGAAALVDDGRTVTGCNVENAAYGVTLCAECGLVSTLHATGGGRLTAFTCCDRDGRIITPCGRCRQLLWEHGGPELRMDTPSGVRTLAELLPEAFGSSDLERVRPPELPDHLEHR